MEPLGSADEILRFSDTVVRRSSTSVAADRFGTEELRVLVQRLRRAMDASRAIGLASPQIGTLEQVIAISIPSYERLDFGLVDAVPFRAIINPEVIWSSEETVRAIEGCMSVKGYEGVVRRPKRVRMSGLDEEGNRLEIEADGLHSRCLQHEIDHLAGILYPDRVADLRDIRRVEWVPRSDPVLARNTIIEPEDA